VRIAGGRSPAAVLRGFEKLVGNHIEWLQVGRRMMSLFVDSPDDDPKSLEVGE
jgi:hypothetical protein